MSLGEPHCTQSTRISERRKECLSTLLTAALQSSLVRRLLQLKRQPHWRPILTLREVKKEAHETLQVFVQPHTFIDESNSPGRTRSDFKGMSCMM